MINHCVGGKVGRKAKRQKKRGEVRGEVKGVGLREDKRREKAED